MSRDFFVTKVRAYLRRAPGATCAEVAGICGVPCAVAGALLRTLRERGEVRSTGNTRGTRYYLRGARGSKAR